jgi:hypothetical protein
MTWTTAKHRYRHLQQYTAYILMFSIMHAIREILRLSTRNVRLSSHFFFGGGGGGYAHVHKTYQSLICVERRGGERRQDE